MGRGPVDIDVAGERLTLRPERALLWRDTLIVADLHWGKLEGLGVDGHVALPRGVLADDLARLSAALAATGARRLVVLGDLIHNARGLTAEVVEEVAAWRDAHPVELCLVPGNHDRHVESLPRKWRVGVADNALHEPPFRFTHDPADANGGYTLAGHVHPVVTLSGRGDRLRLPCFHFGGNVGVLPAFSAFTGGVGLPRRRADRVFAVAEGAVVEV